MAQHRLKIWLSHLADIFIFFKNEIFLSALWLEIWWDVVRHPYTPVLQLGWGSWVLTGRRVAYSAKKRNPWFLPGWTPTKKSSIF